MADEESPAQRDVHHALNEAATDPDPTEWPDPYDKRPDPRDPDAEADERTSATRTPRPAPRARARLTTRSTPRSTHARPTRTSPHGPRDAGPVTERR
jgi:hypothetical protein